jgi:hypothetical protein
MSALSRLGAAMCHSVHDPIPASSPEAPVHTVGWLCMLFGPCRAMQLSACSPVAAVTCPVTDVAPTPPHTPHPPTWLTEPCCCLDHPCCQGLDKGITAGGCCPGSGDDQALQLVIRVDTGCLQHQASKICRVAVDVLCCKQRMRKSEHPWSCWFIHRVDGAQAL